MAWLIDKAVDLRGLGAAPVELVHAYVGDTNAYTWRVTVTEGGAVKDLTGYTVTLQFLRIADASEIDATGTIAGNVATLTIPQACFAYAGVCGAVMRLVNGTTGENTPVCGLTFAIRDLHSDTVVDPGTVVPDLTALLAVIDSALTATTAANNAANYATGIGAGLDARTGALETAVDAAESTIAGHTSQLAEIGTLLATNKIEKGDGSTLDGWLQLSDWSTGSLVDWWIRSTKNTTHPFFGRSIATIPAGHKVYWCTLIRSNKSSVIALELHTSYMGSGGGGSVAINVTTTAYPQSVVITALTDVTAFAYSAWNHTSDGDYIEIAFPMMLDLTAIYGAGHEPTAAQMDAIIAYWANSYFEGTVNLAQADKLLPYLVAAIRDLQAAIVALS